MKKWMILAALICFGIQNVSAADSRVIPDTQKTVKLEKKQQTVEAKNSPDQLQKQLNMNNSGILN